MQSEEFDKKVIEAAENHHPVYQEKAWSEMNKLLDTHLPVEKEKRRRLLFWWLLPLLVGGTYIFYTQVQKNKRETNTITHTEMAGVNGKDQIKKSNSNTPLPSNKLDESPAPSTGDNPAKPEAGSTTITPASGDVARTEERSPTKQPTSTPVNNTRVLNKENQVVVISVQNGNTGGKKRKAASEQKDNQPDATNADLAGKTQDKLIADPPVAIIQPAIEKQQVQNDQAKVPVTINPAVKDIAQVPASVIETVENEKPVSRNDSVKAKDAVAIKASTRKTKSSFFLGFSAGPDLSYVSSERAGTVKLVTGVGLGYNYKDRLTIRTGFYTARKVYTAGAASYHTPPAFTQYYPYLEKVDANCKVYEIPVSLSYNFGRKNSRNFFVAGGLSTLLMKEETYNYYYKYTPQGRIYTSKWTISNENKHFFSVLTLSGGYQRSVGKRFSLMAEPYLKLPLGGVGYGRVKLNSSGVLFTAGLKLF